MYTEIYTKKTLCIDLALCASNGVVVSKGNSTRVLNIRDSIVETFIHILPLVGCIVFCVTDFFASDANRSSIAKYWVWIDTISQFQRLQRATSKRKCSLKCQYLNNINFKLLFENYPDFYADDKNPDYSGPFSSLGFAANWLLRELTA